MSALRRVVPGMSSLRVWAGECAIAPTGAQPGRFWWWGAVSMATRGGLGSVRFRAWGTEVRRSLDWDLGAQYGRSEVSMNIF